MLQLSEHFTMDEAVKSNTADRLGIINTPPDKVLQSIKSTAEYFEIVRNLLGNPIHVNSWYRCVALNSAVGGVTNSAHITGYAIDFTCTPFGTPTRIVEFLVKSGIRFDKLICEGTWVHISFAPLMRQSIMTAHFLTSGTTYTPGLP